MAMKEVEKAIVKKGSSGKENNSGTENVKKKIKEEKPATKVVVRRLPPTMTEEQFKLQVSPLPEIDYFYFVAPDMTLAPNAFSRAYLNFVDQNDLFVFTDKFDGYVFIDCKGGEYPAIVEFAPFQRIPKNRPNRKKDSKMGTIESDPVYIAFKERLEADNLEKKATANASKQHFFETSLDTEKKEMNNTPLLDYIRNKRVERQRLRDEKRDEKRKKDLERRKAKEEQRLKTKKDEDSSAVKHTDISVPSPQKTIFKDKVILVTNGDVSSKAEKKACYSHNIYQKEIVSDSCQTIPQKVQELVNLFNISMNNERNSCISNDLITNCLDHKAIEDEIIKKTENKRVNHAPKVVSPIRVQSRISLKKNDTIKDTVNLAHNHNVESFGHNYNTPSLRKGHGTSYPKTLSEMYHHSNVVFKPGVREPKHIKEQYSSSKNESNNFSWKCDTSKQLKTNLAKAVNNTRVDSPKNKPYTLLKRIIHGEKLTNSGPGCLPRDGCNKREVNSILNNNYYTESNNHANSFKTLSSVNGRFQTIRNLLPPFSKKSTVSKSDAVDDKKK